MILIGQTQTKDHVKRSVVIPVFDIILYKGKVGQIKMPLYEGTILKIIGPCFEAGDLVPLPGSFYCITSFEAAQVGNPDGRTDRERKMFVQGPEDGLALLGIGQQRFPGHRCFSAGQLDTVGSKDHNYKRFGGYEDGH